MNDGIPKQFDTDDEWYFALFDTNNPSEALRECHCHSLAAATALIHSSVRNPDFRNMQLRITLERVM